jgi:hypothetical protein
VQEIDFTVTAPDEVVETMGRLADGGGWVILDPLVDDEDVPPAPPFGGIFSGKGPAVPEVSWVPGEPGRRRPEPLSAGIRHAGGPRAVGRLREAGHPVPDGWRVLQDNPRRGLVLELPEGTDHGQVLSWLLAAAGLLTEVPLTGRWRATVHTR